MYSIRRGGTWLDACIDRVLWDDAKRGNGYGMGIIDSKSIFV